MSARRKILDILKTHAVVWNDDDHGNFAYVADQIGCPILVTNFGPQPTDIQILFVNRELEELCGYLRSDLIGSSPKVLQGPETDTVLAKEFVRDLWNYGEAEVRLINRRKDGANYTVDILACVVRVQDEDQGRRIAIAVESKVES